MKIVNIRPVAITFYFLLFVVQSIKHLRSYEQDADASKFTHFSSKHFPRLLQDNFETSTTENGSTEVYTGTNSSTSLLEPIIRIENVTEYSIPSEQYDVNSRDNRLNNLNINDTSSVPSATGSGNFTGYFPSQSETQIGISQNGTTLISGAFSSNVSTSQGLNSSALNDIDHLPSQFPTFLPLKGDTIYDDLNFTTFSPTVTPFTNNTTNTSANPFPITSYAFPTISPTSFDTNVPTIIPSSIPSSLPSTDTPTITPTAFPTIRTAAPTTHVPTPTPKCLNCGTHYPTLSQSPTTFVILNKSTQTSYQEVETMRIVSIGISLFLLAIVMTYWGWLRSQRLIGPKKLRGDEEEFQSDHSEVALNVMHDYSSDPKSDYDISPRLM